MRLIDADALVSLEEVKRKGCAYIEEINNAPTIDAVPVVRCKDCKYYTIPTKPYKSTTPYCLRKAKTKMQSDGFCSCGERKDDDRTDF